MAVLRPIMPYLKMATLIFIAGMALGFFGSLIFPGLIAQLFNSIFAMIEELGREILQEQPPLQGTITLFIHNFRAVAGSIILGAALGVFPVIGMIINGSLLGVVMGFGVARASILLIAAGILPHGIIEIPALIIGAGAGLYLGWGVFNKRTWPGYKQAGINASKILLLCAGLLAVAAVIEVNITPLVMNLVQ
ncbi:MAG: stage II sporulation protein M [Bacillota bacterium]|nr:stage II sporulation protein M [Bacillota bacterium]